MSDENITITDKDGFRATLSALTQLRADIDGKIAAGSAVTEAATAAASKGVVYGGGDGGKVAAAYTGTVGALGTAVDSLASQAKSASAALGSAIADLTKLLDGLTEIDTAAAGDIKAR